MLTPADRDQPGNVCAVTYWTSGTIYVECRDRTGAYEDTGFSISYAVSGPTIDQQGAHAWFNGTAIHAKERRECGRSLCRAHPMWRQNSSASKAKNAGPIDPRRGSWAPAPETVDTLGRSPHAAAKRGR